MISSIIISILFVLTLYFCGYILYLKYRRKYTRERFAFYGVSVMVTLLFSFITQIYSSQGYVSAFINTTNIVFDANISSYKTDYRDHLLTLFILIVFMRFILKLHSNWDGPISEALFNKRRYHENSSIITESILQLKDYFSKEKKIQLHSENGDSKYYNIFTSMEDDKTPWHESVYELLSFSSTQYKIDLQNDYYRNENVFISNYGTKDEPIAILCCIDKPNDSRIKNYIQFCKKQKVIFTKYIIAVKNEINEPNIIYWNDIEIQLRYENEMLDSLVDISSYR